jgi:uncharacterized membrane-anchored protein YjiN (DUF445 family)
MEKIVTAGFERQPLVDFADWFAVSALFHEIQFPKAYKIIMKTELTEGIVDLVTNKWLSPNVIAEKLDEVDLAKIIVDFIQTQTSTWDSFDSRYSIKIRKQIRQSNICEYLTKILKEQVASIDLASLGTWLEKKVKNGDHHQIWELIMGECYSA